MRMQAGLVLLVLTLFTSCSKIEEEPAAKGVWNPQWPPDTLVIRSTATAGRFLLAAQWKPTRDRAAAVESLFCTMLRPWPPETALVSRTGAWVLVAEPETPAVPSPRTADK